MHICTVTVACAFVIILISVRIFFSLSSPCTTNELSFPLLIFFFLICTQTNTPTPTHKQAHTDKPTERQIEARGFWSVLDWSMWVLTGAWSKLVGLNQCLTGAHGSWSVLDWGSWVLIVAWLELVLIGSCGMIGARGSFAWTELDREGSCLIEAREIWPRGRVDLCWSELGSLTEKGLAWGRVDRS